MSKHSRHAWKNTYSLFWLSFHAVFRVTISIMARTTKGYKTWFLNVIHFQWILQHVWDMFRTFFRSPRRTGPQNHGPNPQEKEKLEAEVAMLNAQIAQRQAEVEDFHLDELKLCLLQRMGPGDVSQTSDVDLNLIYGALSNHDKHIISYHDI